MQSTLPIGQLSASTPMSAGLRALLWGVGIFLLGFGLLTLETAISIWNGKTYLALNILDALLSRNFAWGGEAGYAGLPQILSQYYAKSGRIVLHIAMGGIVVGLGMSQFVPALRRRNPTLHRRLGMVVASAMALSMTGALAYLMSSSIESIFSGPTFFIFLWGLAVLALFLLMQAGLAIMARDFRSHMIWMAACFATFMTAPLLRADWVLLGLSTPLSLQRANAAIAPVVLVQSVFVMLLWLSFLGDKDLPARTPKGSQWTKSRWPHALLVLLAVMTAGVAMVEGVLFPLGAGVATFARDSMTVLPTIAGLWAVPTAIAAWGSLDAWDDWMHGFQPTPIFLISIALSGCAAIAVGSEISTLTLDGYTWSVFWKCIGLLQLTALLLAISIPSNTLKRNAWGVFSLFVLWTPACIPMFAFGLRSTGLSQYEMMISSSTLGIGGMVTAALATAMGAKLRWNSGQ